MTDDCDACRTFMKAVEREVSRGKIQGEMAAAIAEMCEEATHGETSQMSVCVAAGEAVALDRCRGKEVLCRLLNVVVKARPRAEPSRATMKKLHRFFME